MLHPIPNGTSVEIQGLFCQIPPEGYVLNALTGQLEYRGVYERSSVQSEQYWHRFEMPDWVKKKIKEWDRYDKEKDDDEPEFYDKELSEYIATEWDRRLNGFWFRNNGKAVYLTGSHYMFMQWWKIDIGYPKYRVPDLEYFYFQLYCIEDPECMGMLELTKRRFGKTYRGGLFLIEYITRTKQAVGGIQSKTAPDAKKVFKKAVVSPFRKLPKFFRPKYDTALGVNPTSEIRFQETNVRGKKADTSEKEELESMIDFASAEDTAYDGQKLIRYFGDEWGKTKEVDVADRHEVVRYCLLDDENKIVGKALYSTTVEKLESEKSGVSEGAKKLWDDSDHNSRAENGRTPSGLYRFFMTADRARNINIYGEPNVELTVKQILADRESVKHNPKSLAARIRKEARTPDEAFSDDGEDCIFNIQNINNRKADLRNNPIYKRAVQYYRSLETNKVGWRDVDPKKTELYWLITKEGLPKDSETNKYSVVDGMRIPVRQKHGVIGVDGYSNTQGGKKYGSKLSGWMFLKFDLLNPEETGKFIGHIYGRPNEKEDMYNQILLAAEYHGYKVWFEFVSDDYYTYFKERGRLGYLGKFPKNSIDPEKLKKDKVDIHYGFPTTEFALTKQNDAMTTYVEHHCNMIDYMELLDDLPKFRPLKRTPSDRTVSAMITLVAALEPVVEKRKSPFPLVDMYDRNGRLVESDA